MMMRVSATVVFAACLVVLASGRAAAEPMFLSKQYTRCSSCHYSAAGGGLLTPYGRSLSGQELSTTRRLNPQPAGDGTVAGEEAFLYGVLGDALGPVQLGISLRPSHLRISVGAFDDSRNLLMNADVSGAVQARGWTVYGEAGRKPAIGTVGDSLYSREHWVSYEHENGLGVKAGRFLPSYGVHFDDHTSLTRSNLGFDKYDQVYGVEVSRTSERSLLQVAVAPGRAESIVDDDGRRAFTATTRLQVDLGPTMVVVGSGLFRDASAVQARSGAAGAALGIAPVSRLTIWTEGNVHSRGEGGGTSFVFVNETSVEVARGVWLKLSPQARTGTDRVPGLFRWSAGADLFPRTHWNVNLTLYRDKFEGSPQAPKTVLAQLHLYL